MNFYLFKVGIYGENQGTASKKKVEKTYIGRIDKAYTSRVDKEKADNPYTD